MRNISATFAAIAALASVQAQAIQLSCRADDDTHETVCYYPKDIKSNGDLRSFALYTGGPKGVTKNVNLAIVNCKVGYLELRDRKGVVFARNQPSKLYVVRLRDDVCKESKIKIDPTLN
jgi:hypothetical protein